MGELEATISTKAMILKKVTLIGSNGGTKQDIEGLYELLSAGDLDPVTTDISLEDIPEGLDKLRRGEVIGRLVAVPVPESDLQSYRLSGWQSWHDECHNRALPRF